ncbi:LamG domain-containing protein [Pyxidicoccus xibeiensis]|uniref:LamG domain-containing protein n=1 Tax=Pyxidicoccus xibeiensis TaxID=2906759 RepID=UPI0020A80EAF|nr:LamG domain-containing protein [Pyxidicoccus xibeiensis]MCP3135985.1 LamG domain-containing protein [Pyxidicoccus xibeiensis]
MSCVATSTDSHDEPLETTDSALTEEQCEYFEVNGRVQLCHATGSATNPYKILRISEQGCIDGHAGHPGDYVTSTDPSSPLYDPTCQGQGCLPTNAPCGATVPCCAGSICLNGTCQPDLCAGVVCVPLDACHTAGTCNPSTGQCSNPVAPDGTACTDGNACTQPDTCQGGVCTGGPLVGDTTSNLAHRWTFDEAGGSTALDSAGTSDGTLGSSASRTVSFDGSGAVTLTPTGQCDLNAHVDFGLAPGQFGTGPFTVSYWLKTTFNSSGNGDLIGNRVVGSAGNYLSGRLNGDSTTSLEIYEDAAGTNGAGFNVFPTPLNNGSWHQVVYTRGGTSLKMYIDGVQVGASTSAAPTDLTGENPFRIGRSLPSCLGGFFSIPASFDDVRTYSRELTACDVALLAAP